MLGIEIAKISSEIHGDKSAIALELSDHYCLQVGISPYLNKNIVNVR
jgi:hypothetical protein